MSFPSGQPKCQPSPECASAVDVLHRWLDGEAPGVSPEVAAHAALCPECGGRFAAMGQLSAGLIRVAAPTPVPAGLADRIVVNVLADFRRRKTARRRTVWLAGAALAAAVLAAVWLIRPGPTPAPGPPAAQEMVLRDGPAPDPRRDILDAGEAFAALTRRAADEIADAGRQLLPDVPPAAAPSEPVRPLDDARAGLADGFEPLATSARRAARLVLRELSMEDEKK
jgi:hypothetical protein